MTRAEFESGIKRLNREGEEIADIARDFDYPEEVTFSARCVMLERTAMWMKYVSRFQLQADCEIAMTGEIRMNGIIVPPRISTTQSLLNWNKRWGMPAAEQEAAS